MAALLRPSRVVADCQHHLCEPDLKLVWPSAKLLQAACGASGRASHIVTAAAVPLLVDQYNNRSQVSGTNLPVGHVLRLEGSNGASGLTLGNLLLSQCSHRRTLLEVVQKFLQSVKSGPSPQSGESPFDLCARLV